MSSLASDLDVVLRRLDPQTALLLETTIRDALALADRSHMRGESVDAMGYPVGYFQTTAGSFAHEPLERPSQLPVEERESW